MTITVDEICHHMRSAPAGFLQALPDSQAGLGRHKCANCAYEEGQRFRRNGSRVTSEELVQCQHRKMALRSLVSALPDSQGGSGRHKCVICAFAAGAAMDFWIHKEGGGYSSGGPGIDNAGDLTPMQTGGASASHHFTPRKVSYSANAAIGVAGELWVLHSEKRRLLSEDRSDLSDRVVHVSVELGDGAGYDILSFDSRGDETHIEVKTTTGPAEAPFYITKNELEYAKLWSQSYKLIRLYDFNESLNTASVVEYTAEDLLTMELEPVSFRCWPPTK